MEMVPSEENQFVSKEVRLLRTQLGSENQPLGVKCHPFGTCTLIMAALATLGEFEMLVHHLEASSQLLTVS